MTTMRIPTAILAILLAAVLPVIPVVLCVVVALLAFVVARPLHGIDVVCEDQPVTLLSLVSFRAQEEIDLAAVICRPRRGLFPGAR